jgi:hypothetical protein
MAKKYKPVDLSRLRTFSIDRRSHKSEIDRSARLPAKKASFSAWWDALPDYLGAAAIKNVVRAIIAARKADRPVILAIGAHVVKVGSGPIIADLINRGIVTAIAMNGATAIHDIEVALYGETSEEVADTIKDGRFGMVRETPAFFAAALQKGGDDGLGGALARHLVKSKPRNLDQSILAAAGIAQIPVSVHVAVGTDTIHMHANVAQSDLSERSMVDFRLICSVVADMAPAKKSTASGVWCNIGSAVLLPEVFLKALAVARNLGANLDEITTANFDMIRHYRPSENVIGRTVKKGRGHQVTGHHEIMLPLLRQALIEEF